MKELCSLIRLAEMHVTSICAVSSAVEHYTDTVGVGSSNLPSRTISEASFHGLREESALMHSQGDHLFIGIDLMHYGSL